MIDKTVKVKPMVGTQIVIIQTKIDFHYLESENLVQIPKEKVCD